jgi:hypothetical protein
MDKPFGLSNFVELRDSVRNVKPNSIGDCGAEIWCMVDDFIAQFNKACFSSEPGSLEPQIESEGTMESFAELYRIAAHIWPDETISTDLAKDSYEYALKKLNELVEYHQKMKDLFNSTRSTVIKS